MSGTTHVLHHASDVGIEAHRSGVSWGAIIAGAGAAAAAALSIVLYLLGSGLGFSSMSPYEDNSAVAMGIGAILWLSFTQLAASALGGYLARRVAQQTGMDPAAAEQRVGDVYNRGKAAADKARATAQDAADKARKVPPVRHCG